MKRKSAISITDVARHANVSKSTVSLILNSRGRQIPLRAESIQRVRESVRELGYKPNVYARGLVSGRVRFRAIAIIVPRGNTLAGHSPSQALAGITQVVTAQGYSCTVLCADGDIQTLLAHPVFVERTVEGLVALAWETFDYQKLRGSGIYDELPFVALHSESLDDAHASVNTDDFGIAYKLTEHLYQIGRRKFAFIGGPPHSDAANRRLEGFRRYLTEHEIPFDDSAVIRGDYADVDRAAFINLMRRPAEQRPTAIVAVSDLIAVKLMHWLKEEGFSIPRDVAIGGFDGDVMSPYSSTPLTTIRSTAFYQGELAGQMMLDLIAGVGLQQRRVLLPGALLIRESTVAGSNPVTEGGVNTP